MTTKKRKGSQSKSGHDLADLVPKTPEEKAAVEKRIMDKVVAEQQKNAALQIEFLKQRAPYRIEFAEEDYKRDGNPLDVWTGMYWSRIAGVELADWIMGYLLQVNVRLLALVTDPPGNEKNASAKAVFSALGFKTTAGKTSPFQQKHLVKRDQEIFREIHRRIEDGLSLKAASKKVNEIFTQRTGFCPSAESLQKYYIADKKEKNSSDG